MNTNEHEFINDEARMSNDERMTKREARESQEETRKKNHGKENHSRYFASFGQTWFLWFIRVDSWLRSKSKYFDRGRDFDVLVAHDEI
jgi:hypothetical protein